MKRGLRAWASCGLALLLLACLSACVSGATRRDRPGGPDHYYYRPSIHYNTFPETFGRPGPYWVGRPGW